MSHLAAVEDMQRILPDGMDTLCRKNYSCAFSRLEDAVKCCLASPQDTLYRDGLIQRFEFTVELAWKSLREYLEDQGVVLSVISPRAVLKEAYAAGVIDDADTWNAIISARNLTPHVYDEATAVEIARQICEDFLPVLRALLRYQQ